MITENTKKKLSYLDDTARPIFEYLLAKCYEAGLNAQISSAYRSFTEQDKLYQQGRTLPGKIVTKAKAGQSIHNYRRACDFFRQENSKAYFEDTFYKQIWDICVQHKLDKDGMVWGGNWKNFRDTPHFEVSFGKSWKEIAIEADVAPIHIENGNWKIYKNFL